ncbi:hypothetical protein N8076_06740, partial [Gammaproteobacteria bacterium]|nr:hypothetical protein [Gammaproteobacteria bacterium]
SAIRRWCHSPSGVRFRRVVTVPGFLERHKRTKREPKENQKRIKREPKENQKRIKREALAKLGIVVNRDKNT